MRRAHFIMLISVSVFSLLISSGCQRDIPRPEGERPPDVNSGTVIAALPAEIPGESTAEVKATAITGEPTVETPKESHADNKNDLKPSITPETPGNLEASEPSGGGKNDEEENGGNKEATVYEVTYVVEPGDNLFRLAVRFDTTVEAIIEANGLESNVIYVGQALKISTIKDSGIGQPGYYIVQPGENLFRIAMKNGTTVEAIARANGIINPWFIYEGQLIIIPSKDISQAAARMHVVQTGETLLTIALQYNTSIASLLAANNMTNANLIFVGQVLKIP